MGLRDFQQLEDHLQYLEFKVWEYPNLKVRFLTLKKSISQKLQLFSLLISKMPTICSGIFLEGATGDEEGSMTSGEGSVVGREI